MSFPLKPSPSSPTPPATCASNVRAATVRRRSRRRDRLRRHLRLRPALLAARRGGGVDPQGADGLGHEIVGTVVQRPRTAADPASGPTSPCTPPPPGRRRLGVPGRPPEPLAGLHLPRQRRSFPAHRGCLREVRRPAAHMLRALPAGLSLRDAALTEPASVAWHAVARAGDLTGKRVLVIGAGPIGSLIVAVAKRAGASEIIAIDMHDLPLENAVRLGATGTLAATDADAIAAVAADVVFESSGSHARTGFGRARCRSRRPRRHGRTAALRRAARARSRWRSPVSSSSSGRSGSTTRSTRCSRLWPTDHSHRSRRHARVRRGRRARGVRAGPGLVALGQGAVALLALFGW